jgi:hypothetical protein
LRRNASCQHPLAGKEHVVGRLRPHRASVLTMATKPLDLIFAIFWQSTATLVLRAVCPFIGQKNPVTRPGFS